MKHKTYAQKANAAYQNTGTLNQTAKDDADDYDYLGNSCSATDCTGLIPSPPQNQAEQEAYEELYRFQPQPVPKD